MGTSQSRNRLIGGTDLNYAVWAARLASADDVDIVRRLLAAPGIDINAKDKDGNTALIVAVKREHTAIVDLLLAAPGIDINAKDRLGDTALIVAVKRGTRSRAPTAIVDLLLAAPGIDIDVNAEGSQPVDWTALTWAASEGHADIVRRLLAAGADVDAKTNNGATALMWAASEGHAAMVRQLLAAGADVDAKDNYGTTALEIAEALHEEDGWEEHFDVVRAINSFLTEQVRTLWIYRHRSRQRDRLGLSELDRGRPFMDQLVYYTQGFL